MQVNKQVTDIAAALKNDITLDVKSGNAVAASDVYEKNLPEGLDMDTVSKVYNYRQNFAAGAVKAFGDISQAAMQENKALTSTELVVENVEGHDILKVAYDKTKVIKNNFAKEGDPAEITKYGSTTISLKMTAVGNKGQMKAVRDELNAAAAEAFNKKK